MKIDFWISVFVAIPLAIVANLLTPPISRWFDKRLELNQVRKTEISKRRRKNQLVKLTKELERVRSFHQDRIKVIQYLLFILLQVAMLGAFASVYGGMFAFLGEAERWNSFLGMIGRTGGQLITLIVPLLIFEICQKAITLQRRVVNFDHYEKETLRMIESLKMKV